MSQGTLLIFFRRPIAAAITVLAIFFLALPAITLWRRKREQRRAAAGPAGAGPPIAAIREPPAPTEIR